MPAEPDRGRIVESIATRIRSTSVSAGTARLADRPPVTFGVVDAFRRV